MGPLTVMICDVVWACKVGAMANPLSASALVFMNVRRVWVCILVEPLDNVISSWGFEWATQLAGFRFFDSLLKFGH